jgi:hypothetical protein
MEEDMKLTVTCREIEIKGVHHHDVDHEFVNLYPDVDDEIEFVAGPGASEYTIDFVNDTPFLGADGKKKFHFDAKQDKPDGAKIDKTKRHATYHYQVKPYGALGKASGFDPGVNIKP